MSNRAASTSTPTMQPHAMPATSGIPTERIAMRAYEKWMKGGCKHGCDKQNWLEAEAELKAEMTRSTATRR
jgi:hypothetical protein